MKKITATIDVSKIDKSRIQKRTWTNKNGEEQSAQELKIDIIQLREPKVIKHGDGWVMKKTHFIVESPTKEERASKVKTNVLGDGIVFEDTKDKGDWGVFEDPDPSSMPF